MGSPDLGIVASWFAQWSKERDGEARVPPKSVMDFSLTWAREDRQAIDYCLSLSPVLADADAEPTTCSARLQPSPLYSQLPHSPRSHSPSKQRYFSQLA